MQYNIIAIKNSIYAKSNRTIGLFMGSIHVSSFMRTIPGFSVEEFFSIDYLDL